MDVANLLFGTELSYFTVACGGAIVVVLSISEINKGRIAT
jgi:hypothetical protein